MYFNELPLSLIKESSLSLYKESFLSNKYMPLEDELSLNYDSETSLNNEPSLDVEPSLNNKPPLNNKLPLINESILLIENSCILAPSTNINKRKVNNLQKIKVNKKTKPGKSWQCMHLFELQTSTTNLASHLRVEYRLDKSRSLLSLSSKQETSKLQPIRLDLSQPTLLEFNILYEVEPQFQFPSEDIFKQKLYNSINYSESGLKNLINNILEYFAFTTDLWTKAHQLYIGITAYWLFPEFEICKALLTIEGFLYLHISEHIENCLRKELAKWDLSNKCIAGVTDNASSIVKALRDIEILHIRYTAHTIQLGVINGLKEATDLINRAKALNAFIARKNKYREKLRLIQLKIAKIKNSLLDNKNISNSTYLLLNRLLELYKTVKKLQTDLAKDKERDIRNNAKALEKLLLNEGDFLAINELVELLGPFANIATIVSGDYYPTFSMMLPLIKILQEHLFQKEKTITDPIVCKVHDEIKLSF
ncbi:4889_t:CDS:2, partial [Scutellospora calospora]